ncbi:ferritin-like domain-containing protein [Flavobacterium sp.]|uniref:ferritin-like domain-containing protein n=1 Tax=Flavobacterium sp. TaxID=239 RepID=UPI00286B07C9|nr:ferritin-like domain-containing protein [Flavobacterium sp.]
MNISKLLEIFSDDNLMTGKASRRESFGQFGNIGKKIAFASIPFGLSALSNKAFASDIGPTPNTPTGALQLALTLEYLEKEFYQIGLDTVGLISLADRTVIAKISQHENAHVDYLIAGLGGTASANFVPKPTFDFTAGGAFPDVFSNPATFMAVAQAFEDTGVRAYKGQAGNLLGTDLLTVALQIHSVEARHASQIRRMRGQKGWIGGATGASNGIDSRADANYVGEENTMQAGFNTSTVNNGSLGPAIPGFAGAESFDEALNTQQVVTIANLFIV